MKIDFVVVTTLLLLKQTSLDDAFDTLHARDVVFFNYWQLETYMAQLPSEKEKIGEKTLDSFQGCFKTTPLYMFKLGICFPL